ncbi:phosphonate ABC transporter, permease protein PhnE [Leucobacter chromiireducens]|uniref:phosphonate ABC transporter, permease protein PhnE n=1 Tax=Leucobacter chromiireducens TaxID=283877 RepID=UPI003F81212F
MTHQVTRQGVSETPTVVRPPRSALQIRLRAVALILAALFALALWQTGFTPWNVLGRLESVASLMSRMLPPSFSDGGRYIQAVAETLWMVLGGTAIALVIAVPLSALAARNLTTGRAAFTISRFLITLTRSVPSLVLALLFVRAIGVGPMAGVLAMGISSIGMVAKFFADRIEEIDMGIVEAHRASGATRLQVFVSAVLPQVVTNWISLGLYRFDINLRNSVILGFVGAGGIGFELQRVLGQMAYKRVLAISILIFILILAIEQVSALARRAVLGAESDPGRNPFSLRGRSRANRTARSDQPTHPTSAITLPHRSSFHVHTSSREARIHAGWSFERVTRWTLGWGSIALVLLSFVVLGINPTAVGEAVVSILPYLANLFPPDFVTNIAAHGALMFETLWMALAATGLGMVLAIPVGVIAARNATFHPGAARVSRLLTVLVRGIPDLMLAILLVVAVGLGPLAGVLALTIGSIGFTGKLIADAIEDTDLSKQNEAMHAVGATWLQRTIASTLPTAFPAVVGVGLFTFDVYVRSATVMGIVGAGGIGLALDASIRGRQLGQTSALIIMIFAVVYLTEWFSGWLRKHIIQ